MCREHQVRMRRRAGPHADDVPYFVDPDILEPELLKKPLQFLAARLFMKRRRWNFANANLFFNEVRFILLHRIERSLNCRIRRQPHCILSIRRNRHRQNQKSHPSHSRPCGTGILPTPLPEFAFICVPPRPSKYL
jgi:hypothetical protein